MLKLTAAVALLSVVLLAGCSATGQKGGPQPAPAATPVVVVEIQPADVPIFAEFAAQTYARNMVEVRGRVDGYLERWLFRPGSEVRAGDVLYVLDLRPYEASVQQARANLKQGEADLDFARRQVSLLQAQANLATAQANLIKVQQDYERLKPLVDADAASKQDLDAAVAALRAGEANVRASQASVEQATISTKTQIDSTQAKTEVAESRAADRRAEPAVRHHSRAHRRPHRRLADSRRRPGEPELRPTADHHRPARPHLGPVQSHGVRVLDLGRSGGSGRWAAIFLCGSSWPTIPSSPPKVRSRTR